jgi:hypothetical protein
MNRLSHVQLVKNIEEQMHINKYEHQHFFKFMQSFFLYGFLGLFVGGLFDYGIRRAEGTETSKGKCLGFLSIQFGITGIFFYFALRWTKGILPFDDWMMGTFSGFIFSLSFFTVQQSLSNNMTCIFA